MERIAVLTSGGDSQGMNACIKAIVNICTTRDIVCIGVNRGYQGLIDNDMQFLNNEMVENIDFLGGSYLKVSRSPEFETKEGMEKAIKNLNKNEIDAVIVLGGNGSFKGAEALSKEGVKVIGIPGTIDNDLFYTDKTLGFDTAVNNAIGAVDNIRQTLAASNRGFVVETMGRKCGDIALHTAIATCAHAVGIAEFKTTIKDIVADVKHCMKNGVTSPIVVISENVDYSMEDVEKALQKELGIDTRSSSLGYIVRGGNPSVCDRVLGIQWGVTAVELLLKGKHGLALGVDDDKVIVVTLHEANTAKQKIDKSNYLNLRALHNLK